MRRALLLIVVALLAVGFGYVGVGAVTSLEAHGNDVRFSRQEAEVYKELAAFWKRLYMSECGQP